MKKFTFNSNKWAKLLVLPALALITLTINSCKKESGVGTTTPTANQSNSPDGTKITESVTKALREFASSGGSSNQQSGAGSGSNNYSNGITYTTYSTPSTNVYAWSDPTSGASFTLTESTSGSSGGGLGQLAFNGKAFEYNLVLCIKATSDDTTWNGFLGAGGDLRGVVAISGEGSIMDPENFKIKSFAFFFVPTKGGTGVYNFIDWTSPNLKTGDAIGAIMDFSSVDGASLFNANGDDAKMYVTSNGSIEVAETSFTMSSNAKVTDMESKAEYAIDGSISCE